MADPIREDNRARFLVSGIPQTDGPCEDDYCWTMDDALETARDVLKRHPLVMVYDLRRYIPRDEFGNPLE